MKHTMSGSLVTHSESVSMFLLLFQQGVVDNDGLSPCADVLGFLLFGIEHHDSVGVIKNSHAEIDPAVGKILIILLHPQVVLGE